jgi:hypothetical protein
MKKTLFTLLISMFLTMAASGLALAQTDGEYKPVPKDKNTHPAYITNIYTKNGKTYIVADYIQWFEGKDANRIFTQKEPDSGLDSAPDGYYIINDNPKLRTFEVKGDAQVLMQIYERNENSDDTSMIWNENISVTKFKQLFSKEDLLHAYPYHLTVVKGKISKIIQQFIP